MPNITNNLAGSITEYEAGELSDEESVELFQHLVNTGIAWQLQGSYGRTAQDLLDAGVISSPFTVVSDSGPNQPLSDGWR